MEYNTEEADSPRPESADRPHSSASQDSGPSSVTQAQDALLDSPEQRKASAGSAALRKDSRPQSADLSNEDREALMEDTGGNELTSSRPPTTGRMPSTTGRAAFSRVSYATDADYSSDDDDSDSEAGVLITEVKDATAGLPREDIAKVTLYDDVNDDDDGYWDTDLEIEDEREEHDPTGRCQYAQACDRLGIVPASYFARHLTDNEITMRFHGLGSLGTKAIAKVLKTNITVERLNLTGNWMEGEGGLYMSKMLLENDYITYLTLAENKLGAEGAHHFAKMLLVNAGLRSLDLSANDFHDDCAGCFAEALEQNKFLKQLSLSRNYFGEEGGDILGPAIGANDVLDHLDLSWNLLRKSGAVSVARGLKENVRLKICNLSWNGFGAAGATALAEAIAVNETLQELDISGNRLDTDAATTIAKALQKNEELKVLRIGNNPITTLGCIILAKALNQSEISVLNTLDLKDIPVEYEYLKLVDEIKRKRQFEEFHGTIMRSGNTTQDIGKAPVDPLRKKDPLLILREHIVVNDTRIFDILRRYDETESYTVAPEKFAAALEELGVPFGKAQLNDIADKLGTNEEGYIYYGEMMNMLEAGNEKQSGRPLSSSSGTDDTASRQTALRSGSGAVVAKMQYSKKDISV